MQIITAETLDVLGSALTGLLVGQAIYITPDDFKRLTGDDLTDFGSEGRFMFGNLSAQTNCTIATADQRLIFTKNSPFDSASAAAEALTEDVGYLF